MVLKLLTPSADQARFHMLSNEARCLARINSKNVVSCLNLGAEPDGTVFSVTAFIEGEGLDKVLKRERISSLNRFRNLFSQACDALHAVHKCKIVHRNIQTANFLISNATTDKEWLTLLGFTFARQINKSRSDGDSGSRPGEVVGNPSYISPEQCQGLEVDQRADIYSLGCCMFECVTGKLPFEGESGVDTMRMQITSPPHLQLSDTPELAPLEPIILRCLEKQPENRFQSAEQLKLALVGQPARTKPSDYLRTAWSLFGNKSQ